MKATSPLVCCACILAALTGCASNTPHLDRQFGGAVHAMNQQQILNPATPTSTLPATLDGKAAKSAYDNYQKSFKEPVPQTGALSIGVGR